MPDRLRLNLELVVAIRGELLTEEMVEWKINEMLAELEKEMHVDFVRWKVLEDL